jgi:hypothetical protein
MRQSAWLCVPPPYRVASGTTMDARGIDQDRQVRAKGGKRFNQSLQVTPSWQGARALRGAGVINAWSRSIWLFPYDLERFGLLFVSLGHFLFVDHVVEG